MTESVLGTYIDGYTQLSSSRIENIRREFTGGRPMVASTQITPECELSSNIRQTSRNEFNALLSSHKKVLLLYFFCSICNFIKQ